LQTLFQKINENKKRIDVVQKADRTVYNVWLSCRTEPPKMPRIKNRGHVTTLPMAIADAKISAVLDFAVHCG